MYQTTILAKTKNTTTNQFYHLLEEYLKLLRKIGFELIDYKDLIFEEKYKNKKGFKGVFGSVNKPIIALYIFRKVK